MILLYTDEAYKNFVRRTDRLRRRNMTAPVSPCIDRCYTDGEKCPSCGRTNAEVQEWFYADEQRKKEILATCVKRLDEDAYAYWEEQYEYKCEEQN